MRRTAAAATLLTCLALSACASDGFDVRYPSLGVIPNSPTAAATKPAFSRPMGEGNIRYGDVVMDGVCTGVLTLKNTLDQPAGIEVEVEFYKDQQVSEVRRYSWWPAEAKNPLPTERALKPGETAMMELTNDASDGYNGPFDPTPTGCRVTAAHIEANPQPRPCEEKHGTGCPAVGRAWSRSGKTTAPREEKPTTTVTVLKTAPVTGS